MALAALKPDGVILTPPSSDNAVVLELLDKAGTPYVRVGPERAEGLGPRVHMDDIAAAREMTEAASLRRALSMSTISPV